MLSKRAAASVLAIVALGLVASVVLISQNNWTVELSSTQTLAGGLEVTDTKVGTGAEPQAGQKIKVHYVGKLLSGKVFDQGDISFAFGRGQVIKGWDEGLKGMKVGGERNLKIPPGLAYGAAGTPGGPIPPNAELLFSVKLLAV